MQRRAAVAYIAFFLVIAAGSYAFITVAEAPDVTISGDNVQEIQEGDEITVDGRTYNVSAVSAEAESGGGGHGGGGGGEISYEVTFEWTNDSAQHSVTWDSNSTIEYENQTRRVLTENGSDDATLRWEPGDRFAPAWSDGVQVIDSAPNQTGRQDVPVTQYISESDNESIQNVTLSEGDTFSYNDNETTVANVSNESVVLEWTASQTNTVSATNNQNVTLNEQPYVVHFKNNDTVLLGQGEASQQQLRESIRNTDRFHERINGVWGVVIASSLAGFLLLALAFLPRKE